MLIQLDDTVALKYQQVADRAKVPLAKFLERRLVLLGDVPFGQRAVILTGEDLQTLDQLLGIGATQTPQSLLTAVKAWAGITIGDIRLNFSPAQLAEIAYRAERQGKTPEEIAGDIVYQMEQAFFHGPVPTR